MAEQLTNRIEQIPTLGFRFNNKTPNILTKGKVSFEKEPTSKFDKNAVKVLVNGEFVGYVAKEDNIDFPDQVKFIRVLNLFASSALIEISHESKIYRSRMRARLNVKHSCEKERDTSSGRGDSTVMIQESGLYLKNSLIIRSNRYT